MGFCNPIISWMGLVDSNDVNIACYGPIFNTGLTAPVSSVLDFVVGLIVQLGLIFLGLMLAISSLITQESWILQTLGWIIQKVLDVFHFFIPPLGLAALGFGITLVRVTMPKGGAGSGEGFLSFLFPAEASKKWAESTKSIRNGGFDYSQQGSIKTLVYALSQAFTIFLVILILSMNPVHLLIRCISAVSEFGMQMSNAAPLRDLAGEATNQTQGVTLVENLIWIVNMPSGGADECRGAWLDSMGTSDAAFENCMRSGVGDYLGFSSGLPDAGVMNVVMAVFFLVVVVSFAYYLWEMFKRGSLFLGVVIWKFVSLPYVLGWEMFRPGFEKGSNRNWYDKLMEAIFEFVIYLAYFLLIVFLITAVPTLLAAAAGEIGSGVVGFIVLALLFFLGGKNAYRIGPSEKLVGTTPKDWTEVYEKYVTKDEYTGKREINWGQIKTDLRTSAPIVGAQALITRDSKEDIKKKLGDENKVNSAISKSIEGTGLTQARGRLMWDKAEQKLGQIEKERATVLKQVRQGKISSKEAQSRLDRLDKREAMLKDMIEKKKELATAKGKEDDLDKVIEFTESQRESMGGKRFGTMREYNEVMKKKNAERVAAFLGDGMTTEKVMNWDKAPEELERIKDKIALLDKEFAEGNLPVSEYVEQVDKLNAARDSLEKIVAARSKFYLTQGTGALVQHPDDPKKIITLDQYNKIKAYGDLAKRANMSPKDLDDVLNKDAVMEDIMAKRTALMDLVASGAKTSKEIQPDLKKNKEAEEKLLKNEKLLARLKSVDWDDVEIGKDKEGNVIVYTGDELRAMRRKQQKEKEHLGSKEYADQRAQQYTRDMASRAVLGGESIESIHEQHESLDKELMALRKNMRDEEDGKARAKIEREIREKMHERDKISGLIDSYEQYVNSHQFVAMHNPFADPKNPLSNFSFYEVPAEMQGKKLDDNMRAVLETRRASESAQLAVYKSVQPILDNIRLASETINNPEVTTLERSKMVERSMQSSDALANTLGEENPRQAAEIREAQREAQGYFDQAMSLRQEIDSLRSEGKSFDAPLRQQMELVNRSLATLDTASRAAVQSIAREKGEIALSATFDDLQKRFAEQGKTITLDADIRVSDKSLEELQSIPQDLLMKLKDKINLTISDEDLENIRNAGPNVNVVHMLECSELAESVYTTGTRAAREVGDVEVMEDVETPVVVTITDADIRAERNRQGAQGSSAAFQPLVTGYIPPTKSNLARKVFVTTDRKGRLSALRAKKKLSKTALRTK